MCLVSPIKFFTTDLRGFTRIRKKAYSWDPWESVACLSGFRRGKEIVLREKDGAMARAFDLLAEFQMRHLDLFYARPSGAPLEKASRF